MFFLCFSTCVSDLLTLAAKKASPPLDKRITDAALELVVISQHGQLGPFTCKLMKCLLTIREITTGPC